MGLTSHHAFNYPDLTDPTLEPMTSPDPTVKPLLTFPTLLKPPIHI